MQLPDEVIPVEEIETVYVPVPSDGGNGQTGNDSDSTKTPTVEQVIKTRTVYNRTPVWVIVLLALGGALIFAAGILVAVRIGRKNRKEAIG